jgi:hypothetical protein
MTGLGYIGVDVVLDRDLGPLILELNARPGLNIQIANAVGIHHRLELVEEKGDPHAPAAERIAFSVAHFESPGARASAGLPTDETAKPQEPQRVNEYRAPM